MKNIVEQREKMERIRVGALKDLIAEYPDHPAVPTLKRAVSGLKDKTWVHTPAAVLEALKNGRHINKEITEGYDEDEDADFEIHRTVVGRLLGQPLETPTIPAPSSPEDGEAQE